MEATDNIHSAELFFGICGYALITCEIEGKARAAGLYCFCKICESSYAVCCGNGQSWRIRVGIDYSDNFNLWINKKKLKHGRTTATGSDDENSLLTLVLRCHRKSSGKRVERYHANDLVC